MEHGKDGCKLFIIMKLKKKHYEIAKTIAHFVDRNYYPDFTEPTREQIDIFMGVKL
jgi:hypothetical protein